MLKTFTLKYGVMEPPPVDVQRARARRLRVLGQTLGFPLRHERRRQEHTPRRV